MQTFVVKQGTLRIHQCNCSSKLSQYFQASFKMLIYDKWILDASRQALSLAPDQTAEAESKVESEKNDNSEYFLSTNVLGSATVRIS
jgi:hypothetical protein